MRPLSDSEFEAEYGVSPSCAIARVKAIAAESDVKWKNLYNGIMLRRAIDDTKEEFEQGKSEMSNREKMQWRMKNANK